MTTLEFRVREFAQNFLQLGNEVYENVNRYFDGSNETEDVKAYEELKSAEQMFINALNEMTGEHYEANLDYELAEAYCGVTF